MCSSSTTHHQVRSCIAVLCVTKEEQARGNQTKPDDLVNFYGWAARHSL